MCPSFMRIRLPAQAAAVRLRSWLRREEAAPPRRVRVLDAVGLACDTAGEWRGAALLIFEHDEWTVFEDLSGCLGAIPAEEWRTLAGQEPLVYAGYDDTVPSGELVVVETGRIARAFVDDARDPAGNVDVGGRPPLRSWLDVAGFVDEDAIYGSRPEEALLWVLAGPPGSESSRSAP